MSKGVYSLMPPMKSGKKYHDLCDESCLKCQMLVIAKREAKIMAPGMEGT